MKQSVSKGEFIDGFARMDRKDNFSHKALEAMYSAFLDLEEDLGEEMDYDVIAICCDYSQYKTKKEAAKENGCNISDLDILCEGTGFVVVINI